MSISEIAKRAAQLSCMSDGQILAQYLSQMGDDVALIKTIKLAKEKTREELIASIITTEFSDQANKLETKKLGDMSKTELFMKIASETK